MRPLEVVLLAALAGASVLRGFHRQAWSSLLTRVTILLVFLLLCHLVIEGWRWQMFPAYVAVVGLAVVELFPRLNNSLSFTFNLSFAALVLIFTVASAAVAYIFPVFLLPVPQGRSAIGTFTRYLVDPRRLETNDLKSGRSREMMIQVWYPATHAKSSRAWYRDPAMNSFKSSHLRLVKTLSFWNLPAAQTPATFPILLFSPSSGGNRNQNTFQVEELASRGYVVVGIDHPYSSSRIAFPDGRIVRSLPNAWIDLSSPAHLHDSTIHVEAMVRDQVADVSFVIDELTRWDETDNPLRGHLDLSRVGIFGHSFGGAIAAEACVLDPRIRAAINMDGWIFGNAFRDGISKPFLLMNEDAPVALLTKANSGDPGAQAVVEASRAQEASVRRSQERFGGYSLTIRNACHSNFADFSLFTRDPFGGCRVDPRRAHHIVNVFTLAFFNHFLNGQPEPILDRGGFPEEVSYNVYHPNPITSN